MHKNIYKTDAVQVQYKNQSMRSIDDSNESHMDPFRKEICNGISVSAVIHERIRASHHHHQLIHLLETFTNIFLHNFVYILLQLDSFID